MGFPALAGVSPSYSPWAPAFAAVTNYWVGPFLPRRLLGRLQRLSPGFRGSAPASGRYVSSAALV